MGADRDRPRGGARVGPLMSSGRASPGGVGPHAEGSGREPLAGQGGNSRPALAGSGGGGRHHRSPFATAAGRAGPDGGRHWGALKPGPPNLVNNEPEIFSYFHGFLAAPVPAPAPF